MPWNQSLIRTAATLTLVAEPLVAQTPPPRSKPGTPVQAEMRNVDFRVDESITLRIGYLRGRLVPRASGEPAILDDPNSFDLVIDSAKIRIGAGAMGELLNRYAFDYKGAPIRGLRVEIEAGKLRQRGRMNGMPFNILSEVRVTPEGELRLSPVSIKAFGISVKGLMRALGMELEGMLNLRKAGGVRVVDNDLYINPTSMVPPPRIRGHLASIQLEDSTMVQIYRPAQGPVPPPLSRPDSSPNYMYYRGGALRFGLLTMDPADLFVKDAAPNDPFDVFLARYNGQLIQGFSKNTERYGLITTMPDYKGSGVRAQGSAEKPSRP